MQSTSRLWVETNRDGDRCHAHASLVLAATSDVALGKRFGSDKEIEMSRYSSDKGKEILRPVCVDPKLYEAGGSRQCVRGYERFLLLLQDPFGLVLQRVRDIHPRIFSAHSTRAIAFMDIDEVRKVQRLLMDISENIGSRWKSFYIPAKLNYRPEKQRVLRREDLASAERATDSLENLLLFLWQPVDRFKVSCLVQQHSEKFASERKVSVTFNKIFNKRTVCKIRENLQFAINYGYTFMEEVDCQDENNAESSPFSSGIGRTSCMALYGLRDFLPETKMKLPPMLYTFPGSGNTYCRLLIEYNTGVYSGSLYSDRTLKEALPGERSCGRRTSIVKVHPDNVRIDFNLKPPYAVAVPTINTRVCKRGMVHYFEKAVVLVRDPFKSLWSEFQRMFSRKHAGVITRETFDREKWEEVAVNLAHYYHLMFTQEIYPMKKGMKANETLLIIHYEDLVDFSQREEVLSKLLVFMGHPVLSSRVNCSFLLADRSDVHRAPLNHTHITIEEAYSPSLVCLLWYIFGTHASTLGYTVFRQTDCSRTDWRNSNASLYNDKRPNNMITGRDDHALDLPASD